jgi:hypothetical protein
MTIVYDLGYWSESRDGRAIGGSVRIHDRISLQLLGSLGVKAYTYG